MDVGKCSNFIICLHNNSKVNGRHDGYVKWSVEKMPSFYRIECGNLRGRVDHRTVSGIANGKNHKSFQDRVNLLQENARNGR